MIVWVGFRKKDGSIGITKVDDVENFEDARQAVTNHTESRVALALIQGGRND